MNPASARVTISGPTDVGRRVARGLLACAVVATVSGCATVYEGPYDFHQGWRKATVEEAGAASGLLMPASTDCRRAAPEEKLATMQFAWVSYVNNGHRRTRIAALPEGAPFRAGELVDVHIGNCTTPITRRSADLR